MNTAIITAYDVLTPYGMGVKPLWDGLMEGISAIKPCGLFNSPKFRGAKAALTPITDTQPANRSRVMRMLAGILSPASIKLPADAALLVATTTGEIDLLEQMVLNGTDDEAGRLPDMLEWVSRMTGAGGPASVVSAACASSTAALAKALIMIRSGVADTVCVVAVDALSEFVFSGFSSLMALDEDVAHPFDRDRAGLSLGEAAGFLVLMSRQRAQREGIAALGSLTGAALTNDANHMTGPSRDGEGLARAIAGALRDAGITPHQTALIAAHGTGTRYNDAMEMKALKTVLGAARPTLSIKGGVGHTMGNAGLLQVVTALESLKRGLAPPTVGLRNIDEEAQGWASPGTQPILGKHALVVNAGFGGINAAVVLESGR